VNRSAALDGKMGDELLGKSSHTSIIAKPAHNGSGRPKAAALNAMKQSYARSSARGV